MHVIWQSARTVDKRRGILIISWCVMGHAPFVTFFYMDRGRATATLLLESRHFFEIARGKPQPRLNPLRSLTPCGENEGSIEGRLAYDTIGKLHEKIHGCTRERVRGEWWKYHTHFSRRYHTLQC